MRWQDHITQDPDVMLGKPTVRGTRVTVEHILARMGEGWTVDQIVESHPALTREAVHAAATYAAQVLALDDEVILREAS